MMDVSCYGVITKACKRWPVESEDAVLDNVWFSRPSVGSISLAGRRRIPCVCGRRPRSSLAMSRLCAGKALGRDV